MSKRFFRDLDEDDSEEEAIFKTIQSNESNTTHGNRSIKPLEFMYGAGTPTATSSTRTNGVSAMNLAPNTNSSISVPRKKRKKFLDDSSSDDHFDSAPSTGRSQRANIFSSSNVVDGKDIAHSLSQVSSQSPPKKHKRIADFFADSDIDADDISVDIAKNVHEEEADSMPKATSASSSSAGDGAIDFVATYGLVERSYGDEYRPYVESGEYKQANQELILYASDEKRLVLHKYAARQLLNHQVEGAKWLAKKFVEKRGGILGDEMGLGKTIQVAAFLNALYGKTGTSDVDKEWMRLKKRHDSSTEYPSATCKSYCEVLPTLIICPKTLVDNWKRELNKWGYFLLDILTADLDHDDADSIISRALIQRSELVLISYSQVGKFCQALSKVHWNVVIYDEGHLLKNPNNQTYERIAMINKSDCRLILTGTPLQNNLGELWALLHLLDKARYPDKKTFSKEIERPMKLGMSSHASKEDVKLAKKAQEVVDEIISDCLIQRKKNVLTGDSALKGKDEIIVLCDLSTLQQELYEYCLSLPDFENVRFHATLCPCNSGAMRAKCCPEFRFPYQRSLLPNQFKIDERAALWKEFHSNNNPCNPDRRVACPLCILLPCLNTLSKIASHPMLIQADPKSADVEKQNKTERFISATFPPDLVEKLGGTKRSNRFMTMKSTEISGKMKTLREMLAHFIRNDEKSLVFSIRTQVLDVLEAMCIAEGWKFLRLDGQTATKRRQQLVDEYNKDGDLMIFLISSKAGGVGLNLCSANKVIIFDVDWNPVVDMQSQDRAYRIGQMEHVSVYRLVAKGTIEELAYMRQLYKQQFHQVVLPEQQLSSAVGEDQIATKKKFQRGRFEGVDGEAKMRGELFGVENLFQFSRSSILHSLRQKYDESSKSTSSSGKQVSTEQKAKRSIPSSISNQALGNEDVTAMIRQLVEESNQSHNESSESMNDVQSPESNGSALNLLKDLGINLKNAHSVDQMLQDLKEGDEYESASDHESASEKDTNSMNKFDQNSFKIRKATKKQAMFSKPQIPKKVQLFDPNRVLPLDYIPSNNTTIAVTAKKIAPIFTKTLKLNQSSSSSAIIDLTGNVIDAVVNTPCGPSTPQQPGATQNSVEVIELSPPSSQASSIPDSQSPSPQRTMRKLPHLNNPKASGIEKKTASSLYIPSYKK